MKPKVLVVDDEPEFVQLLEYNLSQQGFVLFTARDGLQALHQARRVLPDVILLDLMLPDLDGFAIFEVLRAQPSTSVIPIIIISALTAPSLQGRTLALEPRSFFQKPVDLKALGLRVRELVEQHADLQGQFDRLEFPPRITVPP
jgi:DNA-binding response OmpR family regulator